MRAGGAGATGATEYLPTKLANNERKKIKTKNFLVLAKCGSGLTFTTRHGNGTDGRRQCPRCKLHTNNINTTRLDWGWTAAWQINVGLWPGVGAGTKITSQHGKRREIQGKIKYVESTCSGRTGARVATWLLSAWRLNARSPVLVVRKQYV
jgi:hypothetical protein